MVDFVFKILIVVLLVSCGQSADDRQKEDTASRVSDKIRKIDSVYIDTFLIKNTRFKIVPKVDKYTGLEVYVWKNGTWAGNLLLPYATNGYSFDGDVNEDGFDDFQNSLLRGSEVYLFDPTLMQFSKTPVYFAFDWCLLDKKQKLYANNYEIEGYNETNLFRLEGVGQVYYYRAPIEYKVNNSEETETLRIYKIANNDLNDTTFITQKRINLLADSFDYRKFWMKFIKNYR